MKISFDPAKRRKTLRERGIDFADAAQVFAGLQFETKDNRFIYPEPRMVTIGFLKERMVVVVWTPIANGRRVISMRKANEREQKIYRRQFEK